MSLLSQRPHRGPSTAKPRPRTTTAEADPARADPAPHGVPDEPSTTSASPAIAGRHRPLRSQRLRAGAGRDLQRPLHAFGLPLRAGLRRRLLRHLGPAVAERGGRAVPDRTDDGWRQAWLRFAALEPDHTTVPADGPARPAPVQASDPQPGRRRDGPRRHRRRSSTRIRAREYLLGYGRTFFGIWDRQSPDLPVERFARDDSGWAAAWSRYTQMESNFTEVKLS